jgi:hypothetical protein
MTIVSQLLRPEELARLTARELDQLTEAVGLAILRSKEIQTVLRREVIDKELKK